MRLDGWDVARFTWEDVMDEPDHVTEVLQQLLLKRET